MNFSDTPGLTSYIFLRFSDIWIDLVLLEEGGEGSIFWLLVDSDEELDLEDALLSSSILSSCSVRRDLCDFALQEWRALTSRCWTHTTFEKAVISEARVSILAVVLSSKRIEWLITSSIHGPNPSGARVPCMFAFNGFFLRSSFFTVTRLPSLPFAIVTLSFFSFSVLPWLLVLDARLTCDYDGCLVTSSGTNFSTTASFNVRDIRDPAFYDCSCPVFKFKPNFKAPTLEMREF